MPIKSVNGTENNVILIFQGSSLQSNTGILPGNEMRSLEQHKDVN